MKGKTLVTDKMTERDAQDQKFNLPTHETTNHVNTAGLRQWDEVEHSLVEDYMGDKERHGSPRTYDIESSKKREMKPTHHKESSVFDEAYHGDVTKLFDEAYKGNVFKLAIKYTNEEPQDEHDDRDRDKQLKDVYKVPVPRQRAMEEQNLVKDHRTMEEGEIAPLDALYPMMRLFSDGEKQQTQQSMSAMHKSTYQEGVKNETYRENRSCAMTVVMTALHHPRDRHTHTTSLALTLMQGASRRKGAGEAQEDQDDPLRHGGGGGA
jgi:hypothetical protein